MPFILRRMPEEASMRCETPGADLLSPPVTNKTIFPALLLFLLAQKPDHGYGLFERMESVFGEFMSVGTNRIYPTLQRFEDLGLITGRWDHPTKRRRRIYSVTSDGLATLRQLQQQMQPHLDSLLRSITSMRELLSGDAVDVAS